MRIVGFLTKDWRHIAVTGLACFVGAAFITDHISGNLKTVGERKAAEQAISQRFDEIAAELGVVINDDAPAAVEYKEYNGTRLTVFTPNAACEHWRDLSKYLNLKAAGEDEVASKLGCFTLPKGWEAIYVDQIGEQYTEMLVTIGGQKLYLWMRSDFLKRG